MTQFRYRTSPGAVISWSIMLLTEFICLFYPAYIRIPLAIAILITGIVWYILFEDPKGKHYKYFQLTRGILPHRRWLNMRKKIHNTDACPKEAFAAELADFLTQMRPGVKYRAYTHQKVIDIIVSHPLVKNGEIQISIRQGRQYNVANDIARTMNKNCTSCRRTDCATRHAKGQKWNRKFYGIEMVRKKCTNTESKTI